MDKFYFAQKAFVVHENKLLLVRKADSDPSHPGKWEVPGGRMNFGEEVDEHIKRETREEVGIEISPGPPFYIWQWVLRREDEAGHPYRMQVVAVARLCTPNSQQLSSEGRVDEDHLGEMEWTDISKLSQYEFIPNMGPVIDAFYSVRQR
jgi:8-oxo-dGTP pyrophosphatase MutT (NUDIX family)